MMHPRFKAPATALVLAALAMPATVHGQAAGDDEAKFQRDLARLKNCATLEAVRAQAGTRPLTPYERRLKAQLVPWYLANCRASGP